METRLTRLLQIEAPIISAPMGPNISGPELVAAVSNAGGLGILQAQLLPPDLFREELQTVRKLTEKPFGVNFLLQFPSDHLFDICLEEKVPVISLFWGVADAFVWRAHQAGCKVVHQVGSIEDAVVSAKAGVDVVIAQGFEAGGHSAGRVSTMSLVPRIVDAIPDTPVVAAGGIADARGLVAALALGADGVAMGTRFLATPEANAHPLYKEKLLAATENDTVRTLLFGRGWPHAPHRVLRTPFVAEWAGREMVGQESRPDEPQIGQTKIAGQTIPLVRFAGIPPSRDAEGEIESMPLYMGQSAGLIHEIKPAGDIVREIAAEAEALLARQKSKASAP
jgi:nitronate monooxygenase